ncbi:hypothetical protein [Neisseria sp. CCUG12390]|uniref:hypothetical protein n=1 Tax=Neisseria sp. CCUG12390 TaxID=3392035 RepID=UPI003A103034
MKPFILLGLCAALSLTACHKERNMYEQNASEASGYPTYELPKGDAPPENVKINPNRREHYQAVIKIKDAPLTFQIVRGNELYQATNCYYVTNRWVGATANPQYRQILNVIKIDDTTYAADFYTDTPLDEDYYGEGVCKWQFLSGGFVLLPTGKDKHETALIVDIEPEILTKLSSENPEIKTINHYIKTDYPVATRLKLDSLSSGLSDTGIESWHEKPEDYTPNTLFSVELTIRKVQK